MSGNGNGQSEKVIATISIEITEGGGIFVRNFPAEYSKAMTVMMAAMRIVADAFMQKAVRGDLREQKIVRLAPGFNPGMIRGGGDG